MLARQYGCCARYQDNSLRVVNDHRRPLQLISDIKRLEQVYRRVVHATDPIEVHAIRRVRFLAIHRSCLQLLHFGEHRFPECVESLPYAPHLVESG